MTVAGAFVTCICIVVIWAIAVYLAILTVNWVAFIFSGRGFAGLDLNATAEAGGGVVACFVEINVATFWCGRVYVVAGHAFGAICYGYSFALTIRVRGIFAKTVPCSLSGCFAVFCALVAAVRK